MKEPTMEIRDLLCMPFIFIGFVFLMLGLYVGGRFTAFYLSKPIINRFKDSL